MAEALREPPMIRISAIVPTHNRAHTLPRALTSIREQTSPIDEIIVIDDGSSDDSADLVAREFPEVTLIRQDNRGVSAARNRGILAARHPFIALLDSDDSWLPHKLATLRQAAQTNPGFALYHSDEIWMRRGVRVNPMQKHAKRGGWIFRHCLPLCAISPSTCLLDKAVLIQLGLFDENLPACEDYDLWLRLCHRYPVHYVAEPLVTRFGGHEDQLSQRFPLMDRFRVRALKRLLEEEALSTDDFVAARDTLLGKLDILVRGARKHGNQAVIDEFEPLQQHWLTRGEAETC